MVMNMKMSKILLVFIIGIISLNAVFAGGVSSKTFLIKGDLAINSALSGRCISGLDWDEVTPTIDSDQFFNPDGSGNLSRANSSDTLYFAAPPNSTCMLEIYTPNNTTDPIYYKTNLNANAIKYGLNNGIVIGPVAIASTTQTVNFTVKIKGQTASGVGNRDHYTQELLTTTITVPNPNSEDTHIAADTTSSIKSTLSSLPPCRGQYLRRVMLFNGVLKYCDPFEFSWTNIVPAGGGNVTVDSLLPMFNQNIFEKKMDDAYVYHLTIKAGGIHGSYISPGAISGSKIALETIESEHIKDGSILMTDLSDALRDHLESALLGVEYEDLSPDAIKKLKSADSKLTYNTNSTEFTTFKNLNPETGNSDVSYIPINYINSDGEDELYYIRAYNPLVEPTLQFKNGPSTNNFFIKSTPASNGPNLTRHYDYDYNILYKGAANALANYFCEVVIVNIRTCWGNTNISSPWCDGGGSNNYNTFYSSRFPCGNGLSTGVGEHRYIAKSFPISPGSLEDMYIAGGTDVDSGNFDGRHNNVRGGDPVTLKLDVYSTLTAPNPMYSYTTTGRLYLQMQPAQIINNPNTTIDTGSITTLPTGTDINVSVDKIIAKVADYSASGTYHATGNNGSNQFRYKLYIKTILDGDNTSLRNCDTLSYGNTPYLDVTSDYQRQFSNLIIPTTVTNNSNKPIAQLRKQMCVKVIISDEITGESDYVFLSDDITVRN